MIVAGVNVVLLLQAVIAIIDDSPNIILFLIIKPFRKFFKFWYGKLKNCKYGFGQWME